MRVFVKHKINKQCVLSSYIQQANHRRRPSTPPPSLMVGENDVAPCKFIQIHQVGTRHSLLFHPDDNETHADPSCTVLFENTNGIEKSSVVFQMMMIIQIPPPPFIQSFGIQFVQPLVCRFLFSRRRRECDYRSVEEDPQPRLHS